MTDCKTETGTWYVIYGRRKLWGRKGKKLTTIKY